MYTPACKQIENTQRRCSYVAFIDRSKEYRSTTNKGQFHTRYPQTKHNRIYTATCNQIENTRRRCPDVAFIYNIKSTNQQQTNGFTFILEYISYANQLSRYFECEMQNSKNNFLPLVEQELPTLPEHLSSPPVLVGFVLLDHQFYVQYFVDRCLFFCPFYFDHCVVFSSSIYEL